MSTSVYISPITHLGKAPTISQNHDVPFQPVQSFHNCLVLVPFPHKEESDDVHNDINALKIITFLAVFTLFLLCKWLPNQQIFERLDRIQRKMVILKNSAGSKDTLSIFYKQCL